MSGVSASFYDLYWPTQRNSCIGTVLVSFTTPAAHFPVQRLLFKCKAIQSHQHLALLASTQWFNEFNGSSPPSSPSVLLIFAMQKDPFESFRHD